ncbi:major facilitator superfamily domain-containing protein [Flagelloscypha sp. PMI_526]|nr:major facilitator superfamily domain-containing protein [Flagelloscypha sp. PMI_526]
MFYKFGLEWYNGAFITMANERFGDQKYRKIGILTGLNYAMQCVGSIIVAPLIKRFPTRSVLSTAVLIFGLISAILLIVDGSTGGVMAFKAPGGKTKYGTWNPNALFPIYIVSGVSYGTVELIRRVIPRDIVGGDPSKLRRMDATVHILYEVAGTIGAFSSVTMIGKFGYNYSFFLSPVFFCFAGLVWRFVDDHNNRTPEELAAVEAERENRSYLASVASGFKSFGISTYYGAFLVITHRKYVWLISGYALALYGHRYLENGLAPIFAKNILGVSSWSQIIVGGSNFGELLGALSVLLLTDKVTTPLPWLRLDALALNIVWVLPTIAVVRGNVKSAWKLAAIFLPVSYGWAAGDVSLAAYIQSTLAKIESQNNQVSALGAVMAFLYVLYIVTYAILSTVLGNWVDKKIKGFKGDELSNAARNALKYVGGAQFTVLCVIVLVSTMVPRGAFALNPVIFNNEPEDISDEESERSSDDDPKQNQDKEKSAVPVSP